MNQQAHQQRGIQRRSQQLTGAFRDPDEVTSRLGHAEENYNLVAPATAVGQLPEGCAVALTMVNVDMREAGKGGEIYSPGGGLYAVSRSVLNRIAAAAGISWDPHDCRRLDDGSNPYYCHFRAVGHVRTFDGTEVVISGEKEMDLRDGSPQVQALQDRSKSGDITKQLRELRLHILAHAESKAKNRAIRSLGLKPAYTRDDLKKPFVVAKLMWTGHSDDPELRMRFAEMTAQRMLGGSRALFGASSAAVEPQRQLAAAKAPPPVGAVGADVEDYGFDPPMAYDVDAVAESSPAPAAPPAPPSPRPARTQQGYSGVVVPGKNGKDAGKPIEEASDRSLTWWADKIEGDLESDKTDPRWRDRDEKNLAAMRAELERRNHGGYEEPPEDYDGGPY